MLQDAVWADGKLGLSDPAYQDITRVLDRLVAGLDLLP